MPSKYDTVIWNAGTIKFADGSTQSISAGSFTGLTPGPHYIYVLEGTGALQQTTNYSIVPDKTSKLIFLATISANTGIAVGIKNVMGVNQDVNNIVADSFTIKKSSYLAVFPGLLIENDDCVWRVVNNNSVNQLYFQKDSTRGFIMTTGLFSPIGIGYDLGTDTSYFNDINYKTLDDRGCLYVADSGVLLNDGQRVSDIEALKSMQRAPWKSIYGEDAIDFRTVPPIIHDIPTHPETGEELPFDPDNIEFRYHIDKDGKKIQHHDGIKLDGMVSIMIGAIKELSTKIDGQNDEIKAISKSLAKMVSL